MNASERLEALSIHQLDIVLSVIKILSEKLNDEPDQARRDVIRSNGIAAVRRILSETVALEGVAHG